MQPHFPPELLDLIMDEAEDSPPTLHSLSLVSKECAFQARRHIFKHIDLGFKYDAIAREDMEWLRIIRASMERLRNLRKLFGRNETLASCVKSINIRVELYDEKTAFIENLPPVLQRLTSLSSVQITGSTDGGFDWKQIPKRVADAIAECLLQPGIYEVAVYGLRKAPSQLIFSSPSLKRLYLEYMWWGNSLAQTQEHDLLLPPTGSCTALTDLVAVTSYEYIETLALASPSLFSHLKTFQVDFYPSSKSWIACREILRACRGTVERIVLRMREVRTVDEEDMSDEEDIPLLPQVKHLDIGVFSYSWGPAGDPDVPGESLYLSCPNFVQHMRMTLSKYGTNNLEVLESLSLQIDIYTNTCKVTNDHSLSILPDTEEWSFLDEYLSGLANNRLQVKLEFVIKRDVEADELELLDTRETEAVIDPLSEEASAKLPRSVQTGRLLVTVSITFPVYDI
ncbi:hypothetical protein D9611_009236 [Ephemerocybe angulata]|uniref:Uncharacterized protein n=1 Tax=Ephemerocybe angulata TaxID=980116 RepID=A0A8H5F441_9AGAR|nr:hypothetical protein D9611_009236 [Tulosesus angulatus]